jgi:hypothetical protein
MLKDILVASGLTEDDVAQNFAGKLSQFQRRVVVRKIIDLLLTLIALALLIMAALKPAPDDFVSSVAVLIFALGMVERTIRLIIVFAELARGRVAKLTGAIELIPISRTSAVMRIGRRKFNINARELLVLRNGSEYTVYFSPYSRILMSVVPVQDNLSDDADYFSAESLAYNENLKHGKLSLGDDGELVQDK